MHLYAEFQIGRIYSLALLGKKVTFACISLFTCMCMYVVSFFYGFSGADYNGKNLNTYNGIIDYTSLYPLYNKDTLNYPHLKEKLRCKKLFYRFTIYCNCWIFMGIETFKNSL